MNRSSLGDEARSDGRRQGRVLKWVAGGRAAAPLARGKGLTRTAGQVGWLLIARSILPWAAVSGRYDGADAQERVPPQRVVGERDQQRHAAHGAQAADPEALQRPQPRQGIDALGGRGPFFVDRLGLGGPHPPPPGRAL